MQIELTEDERDFIACILYHTVAGDPDGPRQHADNILQKLHGKNCNRFAIGIKLPTEFIENCEVSLWVREMSVPIKYCFLVECIDSDDAFRKLHPIMNRNLRGGHFSIFPCSHDPPCRQITEDEGDQLMHRFREPLPKKMEKK